MNRHRQGIIAGMAIFVPEIEAPGALPGQDIVFIHPEIVCSGSGHHDVKTLEGGDVGGGNGEIDPVRGMVFVVRIDDHQRILAVTFGIAYSVHVVHGPVYAAGHIVRIQRDGAGSRAVPILDAVGIGLIDIEVIEAVVGRVRGLPEGGRHGVAQVDAVGGQGDIRDGQVVDACCGNGDLAFLPVCPDIIPIADRHRQGVIAGITVAAPDIKAPAALPGQVIVFVHTVTNGSGSGHHDVNIREGVDMGGGNGEIDPARGMVFVTGIDDHQRILAVTLSVSDGVHIVHGPVYAARHTIRVQRDGARGIAVVTPDAVVISFIDIEVIEAVVCRVRGLPEGGRHGVAHIDAVG